MSFEGYSQLLCKNGHYWKEDAQDMMYCDLEDLECPICGEHPIWENVVDLTNGNYDEKGNRIDNFKELEYEDKHLMTCKDCGCSLVCSCTKYKIPKNEGDEDE